MSWMPSRWRADLAAVSALLVLTVVGAWGFLQTKNVFGWDAITFFYPWYSLLGESLGSGSIPGWNQYQFSGTPFAADPQSGWAYLRRCCFLPFYPSPSRPKASCSCIYYSP